MINFKCKVCGKDGSKHLLYCDEHYRCEVCGTKDGLVVRSDGLTCKACHRTTIQKRILEFVGDTSFTDEIRCPHCGYWFNDSWEITNDELECSDCGLKMEIERNVEVTYTTRKTQVK